MIEMLDIEKYNIDIDESKLPSDIRINPEYYIHFALLKAQNCFLKDNAEIGFSQYLMYIDHIENLCDAAGILSTRYLEKLNTYKESAEFKENKDRDIIKLIKLANKKLNYLLYEVFSNRTYYGKLEELGDKAMANREAKAKAEQEAKAKGDYTQNINTENK